MRHLAYPERKLRHLISFPFIWTMIVPVVIFDFCLEIYHHICFPLYKMEMVDRRRYIKIDRNRLKYLNLYQKISCMYCGYGNGLLNYARTIAAKTEEYWCGIRHSEDPLFVEPPHHKNFAKYGDKTAIDKFRSGIDLETR